MKTKNITILFVLLLSISAFGSVQNTNALSSPNTSFVFDGQGELVYSVTVAINSTYNHWNLTKYDENTGSEKEIGAIKTGDNLFVHFDHLEDLSLAGDETQVSLKSTSTFERWQHSFNQSVPFGAYPDIGGPAFFMPLLSVPNDYINGGSMAEWNVISSNWNNVAGWSSSIINDEFSLMGPTDAAHNVSIFDAKWDINTGIMLYYNAIGTDGPNTYHLELTFKYVRDQSQWDMNWGVNPGLMWAYDVETDIPQLPFGDDSEKDMNSYQYNNLSDGNTLVFMLHEISGVDEEMNWNGSAMTQDWEQQFHFRFKEIGASGPNGGGPRAWFPIMPLGNYNFYSNISTEFEGDGATTVFYNPAASTFEVGYNDELSYENATWDTSTGLLQTMSYQGSFGDGLEGYVKLNFKYSFNAGEPTYATNYINQRFIVDDVQNGTLNELDFGEVRYHDNAGNEVIGHFKLYDADIFSAQGEWKTFYENDREITEFQWNAKTSSGFMINARTKFYPPGLDNGQNGPPMFYLIIPTGSSTLTSADWWVELANVYTTLGFTVLNDANKFGIDGVIHGENNDFQVKIEWDKVDGAMSYYKVETTNENGDILKWVMHSGVKMIDGSTLKWGVSKGTSMNYKFTKTSEPIPFGDPSNAVSINTGDIMKVTFKELGDFKDKGPFVVVDMEVNGNIESNAEMGMSEPGFEFAKFSGEQNDGPPPFLYFAIPTGDSEFWNWLEVAYKECGYGVTSTADSFALSVTKGDYTISVKWAKDTGLLETYDFTGPLSDSSSVSFSVEKTSEDIVNSPSENSEPGFSLPLSNSSLIALPLLAAAITIIRRKKDY